MSTDTQAVSSPSSTPGISSTYTNGHATRPIQSIMNASPSQGAARSQLTGASTSLPISFYPGGHRSLPGISLCSFLLGITLGVCVNLTIILAYFQQYLWRIPCFISCLCIFHYLEFDMTARYNTVDARVSSFLLFNNGAAYDIANCMAIAECLLRWLLRRSEVRLPTYLTLPAILPTVPTAVAIFVAVVVVLFGQTARSLAMRKAGRSFNHIIQLVKRQDHVLVTDGMYAWSRHPSYLGFFWWGLGTQILLSNPICFMVYAVVLWRFFASRIANEERHLVNFFGQEYVDYRTKVPVLIPFIR